SSLSKAELTASTSGLISEGRFAPGSRTDVVLGPIDVAIREISRMGFSPLRIAKIPMPNVATIRIGLTQSASITNCRNRDRTRASEPSVRAMEIHIGPAALGRAILRP